MTSDPRRVLEAASTVAVVGASDNPAKAAHYVPADLQAAGYRVIPVNPHATEVLGRPCVPSLADVGEPIDLVVVFRPSPEAAEVTRQAVGVGARGVWLQQGIFSTDARVAAEAAGMDYVEDRCAMVDRRRWGISAAGVAVSSRRLGESTQRKRHLWWMLWRGIRKRCAHCGSGRVFRRWFTPADHCPTCGYRMERQEGFTLGGMAINIIVTEAIFGVVLIATLVATVPDVPVVPLMIAGLGVNVLVPLLFYPSSLTAWAAVDLAMRPLEPRELAEARARLKGDATRSPS